MNTTYTAEARTYYPAAPGARTLADATDMTLNGKRVSAVVDADGGYLVFVGTEVIAEGRLDGTEGSLNTFFAAEALIWSAEPLTRSAEDEAADTVSVEDEVAALVGTGATFRTRAVYTHEMRIIDPAQMLVIIRYSIKQGVNVEIKLNADGNRYIELNNGGGCSYGQYSFSA